MASPIGTFYEDVKIVPILSYANANSDRTSEVIDTAGFGRVEIEVHFAAVNDSVTSDIYLTSSDAVTDENTLSSGANAASSSQTITGTSADNTVQYIDFIPEKRYYQLVVNKDATNPSAESAIAHLYHAKSRPVTQASGNTVVGEGTGAVTGESLGLAIQGTK
jgi:hypothetical protein